jgi:predicted dehydrogenase
VIAGGCDPDPEKQISFSKRWDCGSVFSSCQEMLLSVRPHILHIASPPRSHFSLIQTGVRHGVPLIICEKPLTHSMAEAKKILKMLKGSTTALMLNYERRYSRDYVHVRNIIKKRTYGKLLSIHAKLYMGKSRKPAHMLLDDGTHMIDILRFLSGSDFSRIQTRGNVDDSQAGLWVWGHLGSVSFSLELASMRDHLVFEMDLSFEQGRIRVGNGLYEEYESFESPYYTGFRSLKPVTGINFEKTNYFSGMLEDAVRVVQIPEYNPVSGALDGFRSVQVIQEILKKSRRKISIFIP